MMISPAVTIDTTDHFNSDDYIYSQTKMNSLAPDSYGGSIGGVEMMSAWLQQCLEQGSAYSPPNDLGEETGNGWMFDRDYLFGEMRKPSQKYARFLRMQRQLGNWSIAVTGLSNAVQSITQSIRTLTQDH